MKSRAARGNQIPSHHWFAGEGSTLGALVPLVQEAVSLPAASFCHQLPPPPQIHSSLPPPPIPAHLIATLPAASPLTASVALMVTVLYLAAAPACTVVASRYLCRRRIHTSIIAADSPGIAESMHTSAPLSSEVKAATYQSQRLVRPYCCGYTAALFRTRE